MERFVPSSKSKFQRKDRKASLGLVLHEFSLWGLYHSLVTENNTCLFLIFWLKEMATHSSILTWRIPWTEEPGRIQSMGSQRVRHNWATNTFWPHCAARGILVPWPGIEPMAPAVEAWSLNHWITREVPRARIYYLREAGSLARIKIQMLAGLCSILEDGRRNSFLWLPVF